MATAFALSGSFDYPPDDGQPVAKRPFSQSGTFTSKQEADLVLTGSGGQIVEFGTVGMAKAISIEVASTSLAPVNVRFNGGSDSLEIAPGGFLVYASPAPTAGIDQLNIVYSMDARVLVRVLG